MLRNEHFLLRNNVNHGNHTKSIPRNIFGTKFCSQPYTRHCLVLQKRAQEFCTLERQQPLRYHARKVQRGVPTSQSQIPEAKFFVPDWGIKSTLA
jgi:hypothetical protein